MKDKNMLKAYKLFFGTLTSNDRLMIINSLRKQSKTVGELQKELKLEQTRVSHNLKRLKKCGFVDVKIDGKYRIYKLNERTIKPLMNLIDNHMKNYCLKITGGK